MQQLCFYRQRSDQVFAVLLQRVRHAGELHAVFNFGLASTFDLHVGRGMVPLQLTAEVRADPGGGCVLRVVQQDPRLQLSDAEHTALSRLLADVHAGIASLAPAAAR